jgi:SAM-dependent methyltransferase
MKYGGSWVSTFGDRYSKLYNLLYKDKEYQNEFQYVLERINKYSCAIAVGGGGVSIYMPNHANSVLDIGCGTGKYLKLFKEVGYLVSGIDISLDMLNEAKKCLHQEYDLINCKASEFQFNKQFDVIISLFHVMSYQVETSDFEAVFGNVAEHLVTGGLFLFDFWYGPAVLSDPPVVRVKRLEDGDVKITRIAEPMMHYNKNVVDVHYQLLIEENESKHLAKLTELHKMRYLFLPEIEYFSGKAGLSLVDSCQWMSKEPLSNKSWYGFVVLKKI